MSTPVVEDASTELVRALAAGEVTDLPAAIAVLAAVDPGSLESLDRVDLVRAWDRCEAAVSAGKARAVAAVADSYQELGMPASEARHEIGAALRLWPVTAADRTVVSVDLRDGLLRCIAEVIDVHGGSVTKDYLYEMRIAPRTVSALPGE